MKQTGRRFNTKSPRAIVAVSEDIVNLRRTQFYLNQFLWSTELTYGYFLKYFIPNPEHLSNKIGDILNDIPIEAWYLNNQGYIKYPVTVSQHLENVRNNIGNICRSTLVNFTSAFEHYIENRIEHLRPIKMKNWGPFIQSISDSSLINGYSKLDFKKVVVADISRLIRNQIIHNPNSPLPTTLKDDIILHWKNSMLRKLQCTNWLEHYNEKILRDELNSGFGETIGQAISHVLQAQKEGKNLCIEFFYMLFAFTNYDNLAFQIEEALIDPNKIPEGRIEKREEIVRRKELIIEIITH
jgi:hypothetical protein